MMAGSKRPSSNEVQIRRIGPKLQKGPTRGFKPPMGSMLVETNWARRQSTLRILTPNIHSSHGKTDLVMFEIVSRWHE